MRKSVPRNFIKFTGKYLCQSLFFNKVAALRPATLLKNRLWHRCFPVNFVKFLRTPFYTEHLWWLLPDCSNFFQFFLCSTILCSSFYPNLYLAQHLMLAPILLKFNVAIYTCLFNSRWSPLCYLIFYFLM